MIITNKKENNMNRYTIEAYNDTDLGKSNMMIVVVSASSEAEAIEKASKIVERTSYSVKIIEVNDELKKISKA